MLTKSQTTAIACPAMDRDELPTWLGKQVEVHAEVWREGDNRYASYDDIEPRELLIDFAASGLAGDDRHVEWIAAPVTSGKWPGCVTIEVKRVEYIGEHLVRYVLDAEGDDRARVV